MEVLDCTANFSLRPIDAQTKVCATKPTKLFGTKGKRMTEERKQELTQLLEDAMDNLEIRPRPTDRYQLLSINVPEYRKYLQQSWVSHSRNFLSIVMNYELHIASESIKSQLFNFIRTEYAPFIHEDRIQSACSFISRGGPFPGFRLDSLLEQLLKITLAHGTEKAVSEFDRCTDHDTHVSFQYIALLKGIKIESEIQISEGIRLVPLPLSTNELSRYLPDIVNFHMSEWSLPRGETMLIIEATVSPIFHKPCPELFNDDYHEDKLPFQAEVTNREFLNFKVEGFYRNFCHALSLACNSAVQSLIEWRRLPQDELFSLGMPAINGVSFQDNSYAFRSCADVRSDQIGEAKRLYKTLFNLDSNLAEKLQIPIDRWIKSKAESNPVDKMIDLGIALEALYLSGIEYKNEIRFRFSLHAAWHLGEDKKQRKALMKKFKSIYDWRSKAVHTGRIPNKTKKTPFTQEEITEFITKAQDLCRESILKILEDGQFPDWNSLILGQKSS